jgi:hypothetical protein
MESPSGMRRKGVSEAAEAAEAGATPTVVIPSAAATSVTRVRIQDFLMHTSSSGSEG